MNDRQFENPEAPEGVPPTHAGSIPDPHSKPTWVQWRVQRWKLVQDLRAANVYDAPWNASRISQLLRDAADALESAPR